MRADRFIVDRTAAPHRFRWRAIVLDLEVVVSLRKLLFVISTGWAACVLVVLIVRVSFSAMTMSPSEYFGWTFLAAGPFVVALLILRGAIAPDSMTQVLQNAERSDTPSLEAVRVRLRGMAAPPPQS